MSNGNDNNNRAAVLVGGNNEQAEKVEKIKIYIHVEGGLIQATWITKGCKDMVELEIVDYDISDGAEDEEVEDIDKAREAFEAEIETMDNIY
jgi:2,3-bisphosphoglycerate-independent phosphoglycerate mutase